MQVEAVLQLVDAVLPVDAPQVEAVLLVVDAVPPVDALQEEVVLQLVDAQEEVGFGAKLLIKPSHL